MQKRFCTLRADSIRAKSSFFTQLKFISKILSALKCSLIFLSGHSTFEYTQIFEWPLKILYEKVECGPTLNQVLD